MDSPSPCIISRAVERASRCRSPPCPGDNHVRGQPWQAVGIAAAAGLLVGFLFARRSSAN
ncbi:MAG: YqjD family protein [Steroidobacteraceae bacterium]